MLKIVLFLLIVFKCKIKIVNVLKTFVKSEMLEVNVCFIFKNPIIIKMLQIILILKILTSIIWKLKFVVRVFFINKCLVVESVNVIKFFKYFLY